jgi:hypothetical protein
MANGSRHRDNEAVPVQAEETPAPRRRMQEDRPMPPQQPRRERDREPADTTPFGSDGFVPAFLLRPSGAR